MFFLACLRASFNLSDIIRFRSFTIGLSLEENYSYIKSFFCLDFFKQATVNMERNANENTDIDDHFDFVWRDILSVENLFCLNYT